MPKFLSNDVIRLLNGSVEALRLAHVGIGMPRSAEHCAQAFCLAPEMGLIGAAGDLALKASVRQVAGQKALLRRDGSFKTASETLRDFRSLFSSQPPRLDCLFANVADRQAHRESLLRAVSRFRALFSARAAALHMAEGAGRDVAVHTWNDVADFIRLLGASSKFAPYVRDLPSPITVAKQRETLVTELIEAASNTPDVKSAGSALVGVYLVLPEWPREQPDWISALDRVAVAPTRRDIGCLLATLETVPTRLVKASGSGGVFSVRIAPDDPNALPIEPQFLKRSFQDPADQFNADIANANGRLDQGTLHLPPVGFVNQLFALGFEQTGLPADELAAGLTAHQTWPWIASSLNVASNHTTGPVWFLARKMRNGEMGQLLALLARAANHSRRLDTWVTKYRRAFEALDRSHPLEEDSELAEVIFRDRTARFNNGPQFEEQLESTVDSDDIIAATMANRILGDGFVGAALLEVLQAEIDGLTEAKRCYWSRKMCEAADSLEDVPGLVAVIEDTTVTGAHGAARKALRLIDFEQHGPILPELDIRGV